MFNPRELAQALGKKFPPTDEQSQVIAGEFGPKLVVAGAGAGKTETMAARVVSLVANGMVQPEQVLGLTFTRKAAQQLEQRIRTQLLVLRGSGLLVPGSPAAAAVENPAVKVSTYDSFAGDLVREFGLLVPVEPGARLITDAEHYEIAHDVVVNYTGELGTKNSVNTVVETLLKLAASLDNELREPRDIAEHEAAFRMELENLEKSRGTKGEYSKVLLKYLDTQKVRLQYLPLVEALQARKLELGVTTFGEQMAAAAELAAQHPAVAAAQRARFRVVMLDEYQDTSHAQRVMLRALFGGAPETTGGSPVSVTAVGDPMQAIYGWRGATVENLAAFVEDFPQADGTVAPRDQLTVSWRNPARVLDLANLVAADVFSAGNRPVDPLRSRPGAADGEVQLAYFATGAEERDFVARHFAAKYAQAQEQGERFTGAILVRANSHSLPMAQALAEHGVPHEVIGLGGLLWEPEVQDLVALATMLVRPQDTAAALRILAGPIVGLGLDDLTALNKRVRELSKQAGGRAETPPVGEDAVADGADGADVAAGDVLAWLRARLEGLDQPAPDSPPGLTDALADLGERDRYSAAGVQRLEELGAKLRHLRTYSLSKSLGDIFADIEALFNIRTEALARPRGAGVVHLERFAEVVADFHDSNLTTFLDYLAHAREHEGALAPGEVNVSEDRVQIMTIHKAKGLEFAHVAVVHADSTTYGARVSTFLTALEKVPGDDDVIDTAEAETRKDFQDACEQYLADAKSNQAEEIARMFYVALTRTETSLIVTGSGTNNSKGVLKKGPYRFLELFKEKYPELVVHWEVPEVPEVIPPEAREAGTFPVLAPRPEVLRAADLVRAAMVDVEQAAPAAQGELFSRWESDASVLIAEWEAQKQPVVEVELPGELTASDLVSLSKDPTAFARRQRRPVPFKPNRYAKRGTAFHSWLEERFGVAALLEEDQLPGSGEEMPVEELARLKEQFLASEWAERTPYAVEAPFEVTIGPAVIRGRMDAVFQEPDGSFLIVDWKTGRRPQGAEMKSALVQLAVYAEAWRRVSGTQQPVQAAFHYVGENFTFRPEELPGAADLARLLVG